jgi:DNA adenine methylase
MHKLFGYPGGKWPIRHLIVSQFPEHLTYVDVFGGSAAILLWKQPSKGEVFNDKNAEIVNFFRVVKHRPAELAEKARSWIHSRSEFELLRDTPAGLDELDRAIRFWILTCDSFGGRTRTFGTARMGIHSVTHARAYLTEVSDRLKDVHIENLDCARCIEMYDGEGSFFYLDPPYLGTKGGDGIYEQLSIKEWTELAALLKSIKGRFLLSSNDHPEVRRLLREFRIRPIKVPTSLARTKDVKMRSEILVSNYQSPRLKAQKHD